MRRMLAYAIFLQGRFKKQGINGYFRKNPDKGGGVLVFKQRIPFMKPVIMNQFMNTNLQDFFRSLPVIYVNLIVLKIIRADTIHTHKGAQLL